jgi:hypothetical protein
MCYGYIEQVYDVAALGEVGFEQAPVIEATHLQRGQ